MKRTSRFRHDYIYNCKREDLQDAFKHNRLFIYGFDKLIRFLSSAIGILSGYKTSQ